MRSLNNFNVFNKKILVRCDFNVPLDKKGNIQDDSRILRAVETIEYLALRKASITLMGHLGDPNGTVDSKLKLDKVAKILQEHINFPIAKAQDCMGPEVENYINSMGNSSILLLENLKFKNQEIDGDTEFAKKFSFFHEIFINDDFVDCDKFYSSIVGIPQYIKSGAGLVLQKEIDNLNKIIEGKDKPLVVIVGGKSTDTKLKFIDKIASVADWILVGGLMKEGLAKKEMLFSHQEKIIYPVGLSDDFDIDEKTFIAFRNKISSAKSILWYGPLGQISEKEYSSGTLSIAREIIDRGAFSVVCGEELINFLKDNKLLSDFSFISYGGQVALEYLTGDKLPGLVALG